MCWGYVCVLFGSPWRSFAGALEVLRDPLGSVAGSWEAEAVLAAGLWPPPLRSGLVSEQFVCEGGVQTSCPRLGGAISVLPPRSAALCQTALSAGVVYKNRAPTEGGRRMRAGSV